jgi:hypothetical protein
MQCLHCDGRVKWGDGVIHVGYERLVHVSCIMPYMDTHPMMRNSLRKGIIRERQKDVGTTSRRPEESEGA